MRILAFDQSIKRTGWAVHEVVPGQAERLASIVTGSFTSAPEKKMKAFAQRDVFGRWVKTLMSRYRPDFVAWESAEQAIRSMTVKVEKHDLYGKRTEEKEVLNSHQLILPAIEAMIHQVCIDYRIACASVAATSWRSQVFGKGYGRLSKEEAKKMAVSYCQRFKIGARNADEAEAACIAVWGAGSPEFRQLRSKVAA